MFKKIIVCFLVGALLQTGALPVLGATAKVDKEARHAAKVKAGIARLGAGTAALVIMLVVGLRLRETSR